MLTEIVAGGGRQNADTKQLAVAALKSMGEMSYLMPLLSRKDDSAVRQGALAAVRSYTALGPEAAGQVREQLVEEFGEETAAMAGKMIVGFSPQEAANPQLFAQLVGLLSPEEQSVGVRELALDTLKRLTGQGDNRDTIPTIPKQRARGVGRSGAQGNFVDGTRRKLPCAAGGTGNRPRRNEPDDFFRRPVLRAWRKPAGCVIVYPVGIVALEGRFFLARFEAATTDGRLSGSGGSPRDATLLGAASWIY